MNKQEILDRYIEFYKTSLHQNQRALSLVKKEGVYERFIFDNFLLAYSDGSIIDLMSENEELTKQGEKIGLVKNNKDVFVNYLLIPVLDTNKNIINIAGFNLYHQSKNKLTFLNNEGIFNEVFLRNQKEIIFTQNPIQALNLIQNDYHNTTFMIPGDNKYLKFIIDNNIRKAVFTFEGNSRLFYELTKNGISTKRILIDFEKLRNGSGKEYIEELFSKESSEEFSLDTVKEIEHGFLFQLPHLSYRVIGNFSDNSMNLKVNIKAFTQDEVFVDYIDLYKNSSRQSFIYNVMERFNIRDQIQLEEDMHQIIDIIEKHREKKAKDNKITKPELTEYQKDTGLRLLKNPNLVDEIDNDISKLGYVRERKNKILLYLVMTSRLMDNPLHSVIISRSSAGKSQLANIIEDLCPPEDLVSISDLSAQAFYYFGENDLTHKLVVIGERAGSESSEYPIRELISKKSICKAIPVKDKATGQIKTERITVHGPISYIETTAQTEEINQENLSRYFVLGMDESEEQTRFIHESQKRYAKLEGYLESLSLSKIIEKHIFAQRLLRKIHVFIPFVDKLKFPSSQLKTRRDHQKFLRLIMAIGFLHQYQRKVKKVKLGNNKELEYIECTLEDYKIAYELLKDGILDNTLDDIPRTSKELLILIKNYLKEKSDKDNIQIDKIIFTRKEIREYTSWTFVQIRNNFRVLRDYEYIIELEKKKGPAHLYKLTSGYADKTINSYILSPEEL